MSKIRNSFIESLEEKAKNEGFLDKVKNVFANNKDQGEKQMPDKAYTGDYPMTYKDAISALENMINYKYKDKEYFTKGWCQGMLKSIQDKISRGEVKPDDIIKDFGFLSNMIADLGKPEQQEDVADFNTISDTYRMQDMPQ